MDGMKTMGFIKSALQTVPSEDSCWRAENLVVPLSVRLAPRQLAVAPRWLCLSHWVWGGQPVVAQPTRLSASVVPNLVLEVQMVPGE